MLIEDRKEDLKEKKDMLEYVAFLINPEQVRKIKDAMESATSYSMTDKEFENALKSIGIHEKLDNLNGRS